MKSFSSANYDFVELVRDLALINLIRLMKTFSRPIFRMKSGLSSINAEMRPLTFTSPLVGW